MFRICQNIANEYVSSIYSPVSAVNNSESGGRLPKPSLLLPKGPIISKNKSDTYHFNMKLKLETILTWDGNWASSCFEISLFSVKSFH
jgi:hypothetical protein